MSKKFCAVALALLLCSVSLDAKAETALEVQSWCKAVVNGKLGTNDTISYPPNHDTGFCWGAFGAIQELSKYVWIMEQDYLDFVLQQIPVGFNISRCFQTLLTIIWKMLITNLLVLLGKRLHLLFPVRGNDQRPV
jgi:hypothetical protein